MSNPKSQYAQKGYTLVELVLIIVLLAILSAVALPKFFEPNAFEQRAVFDETINALRYAQKLAIATNCQTQFQATSNSYQIMTGTACNNGNFSQQVTNPSTGELGLTSNLNGFNLTATPANITFFPAGNVTANGVNNASITIAGRTITIDQTTGFINAP